MVLSIMMKEEFPLINIPNSRLECITHTLFETKMANIDSLFLTKTAK